MIKAVLFDFDETLQNRTEAFESYMDAFFEHYLPELTGDELKYRKDTMRVADNGGYVDRVKWHEELSSLWGWKDAPPAGELASHYINTFGNHVKIFKSAPEVLKKLRSMGYTVGVLTNGPAYLQNHKMKNSGLLPFTDMLLVSGDIGIHKPDPRIFEIAAERLSLKCEQCAYVGDHPINDIEGALGAGMKPIRMNFGWFKNKQLRSDVPVIEDLNQIFNVLDKMNEESI